MIDIKIHIVKLIFPAEGGQGVWLLQADKTTQYRTANLEKTRKQFLENNSGNPKSVSNKYNLIIT